MHCFIDGNTKEFAIMDDEEDCVKDCPEFIQYKEE